MLKVKKMFSAFLGAVMAANALVVLPFSAFADEETSHTYTYDEYESISWTHDYNYDYDHAVSLFSENSAVFNEIRNWVLSDEMNQYVTKVNAIDTRWNATSADKYNGNEIFNAFDTAFSIIGMQEIQALNEDFHFNVHNKSQSVVVFTLQFGISVSPEVSESVALPKDNVKTIEWVYNGSDEYGDYRYIDDYVEYLGDGWHLTMSGYGNIDLPEPITTTIPTTPDVTTTTTVIATEPNKLSFTPNPKFVEFLEKTNREATVKQTDKGTRILVYNHSEEPPTGHPIPPLKMTVPLGWQITYSIEAIDPSPQTVREGIVNEKDFIYYVLIEKTGDAVYTENEILDWYLSMDIGSEPITTTAPPIIPTESTTTVTTIITVETNTEQTTKPPTTDAEDSVTTETSAVPPTTTIGTETTLPQTGYSKWYQALIVAAMGMIGVGSTAIVRSGIFRKKESNS